MAIPMKAQDAVSGRMAECFVTVNGRRYNFMSAIDFEALYEKTKVDIPLLGQTNTGNKAAGGKGTFSMRMHYNTTVLRKLNEQYQNTGQDVYFEIQVTNNDPTSDAGRQTAIFEGCNLDGGTMAKFDAEADFLDEDVTGTFEKCLIPESFLVLPGA